MVGGPRRRLLFVETISSSTAVVLDATQVAALPKGPLGTLSGVTRQLLWNSPTSEAGILHLHAGFRLGLHTHRTNHHHLWIQAGSAVVLDKLVGPGAYVHIPVGVVHDIDASGTEGCTLFYLYLHEGQTPFAPSTGSS